MSLVVDDCEEAQIPDTDTSSVIGARANCKDTKTTPGENRFLNVATLLELGGRARGGNAWWPQEVQAKSRRPYDGCVRNLKHNGEVSCKRTNILSHKSVFTGISHIDLLARKQLHACLYN